MREIKGYTKPFTGNQLRLAKLAYLNPISNYKRGLEWHQLEDKDITEEQSKDEKKITEETSKFLYVKEKHFSKRSENITITYSYCLFVSFSSHFHF